MARCGGRSGSLWRATGQRIKFALAWWVDVDLVMRRFGIVPGQVFAALLGNHGGLVVGSREGANRIDRIPQHDGDELDFVSLVSPEQVAALVAFTLLMPGRSSGFSMDLISVGVFGFGVSMPDSCDHVTPWISPIVSKRYLKIYSHKL